MVIAWQHGHGQLELEPRNLRKSWSTLAQKVEISAIEGRSGYGEVSSIELAF